MEAVTHAVAVTEVLEGVVRRVLHRTAEGWAVVEVEVDDGLGTVRTVVGTLPVCSPGERIRAGGRLEEHPRYGVRLVAEEASVSPPTSREGLVEVLCGLVSGLGPRRAETLVDALGGTRRALDELSSDRPYVPMSVDQPVMRYFDAARSAWRESLLDRAREASLASLGLTPALRARLARRYGVDAASIARSDPYRLCREVEGVGFRTADELALRVGLPPGSDERLLAALRRVLSEEAEGAGHVYHGRSELSLALGKACELWPAGEQLDRVLERAATRGDVVLSGRGNVADGPLARAEGSIAAGALGRLSVEPAYLAAGFVSELSMSVEPSREQFEAVSLALTAGLCVVTGGPGVGKTTVTRLVGDGWSRLGLRALYCAPTGRAARRLAEATGREATTVHRLLGWRGGGFERGAASPLEADRCLVDESSMLDVRLLSALIEALQAGCQLVLVGDADQLPPVGPGAPFRDLVENLPRASVRRLSRVYRQAEASAIVAGSRRVLEGRAPEFSAAGDRSDGALFLVEARSDEEVCEIACRVASELAPRELGVGLEDVQVLSPVRRGPAGVQHLNERLRAAMCPGYGSAERVAFGAGESRREFRAGERVVQTKNDYERGVVNGELGRVAIVSPSRGRLVVEFDGKNHVEYDRETVRHLELAYCSTVHKAQGAEFPVVVVALAESQAYSVDRALLYTALTRAKKACVVVGTRRVVERAARRDRSGARRTTLPSLLLSGVAEGGGAAPCGR